jgi:hypothetical protein
LILKTKSGIKFSYTQRPKEGNKCVEPQCSQYAQMELYRRSGVVDASPEQFLKGIGFQGNAWQVSDNIVKNNGSLIFDRNNNIAQPVKVGDVVSIYTGGGSNYLDRANKEGDGNSHVGFISKVYPDDSYDVENNNHSIGIGLKGYTYDGKAFTHHFENNALPGSK